ncbi:MAG: prepilin-type N-terminal cleavage/methylation domain-containing protein [Phycisphaerales bacterium]
MRCASFNSERRKPARRRRAFTLIEAMVAVSVLSLSVLALSSAVAAGQQASLEGQKLMLGSLAVSDMMSELSSVPYNTLTSYHGRKEAAGQIQTIDGVKYPSTYWSIGRQVSVTSTRFSDPGMGVEFGGVTITVRAVDAEGRTVASAERFVPEPAS